MPPQTTPSTGTSLNADVSKDGKSVRISLVKNGQRKGWIDWAPENLGILASMFLNAAARASQKTGKTHPKTTSLRNLPLPATRLGILPSENPQHMILEVCVGLAQVGFELRKSDLRMFAEGALAATAAGTKH